MIVIPKDKPIIINMNSYFINVQRLIEHFVGEIGSGGVHFKSNSGEAAIFFEESSSPTGVMVDRGSREFGPNVIPKLLEMAPNHNFNVSIYGIDAERIHYWASLPAATPLHQNLTTEFTDLAALVKKLRNERLTGYIDITLGPDIAANKGGVIFLNMGSIIGSCASKNGTDLSESPEKLQNLIKATASSGGVFNVFQVNMGAESPQKASKTETAAAAPQTAAAPTTDNPQQMLQDLLQITEVSARENTKPSMAFSMALRRKFIQLADNYDFLDPFADEVKYVDGTFTYHDDLDITQIKNAIFQSVKEIGQELNLLNVMAPRLEKWGEKYGVPLTELGIG